MSSDRTAHHHQHGAVTTTEAEQFWERHYRGQGRVFSGNANPILVQVAGQLPAGAALDLGCGEGGDAIWLAEHGWDVTAVDVAATALSRAAEHATAAGVANRIAFQQHDLTRSQPAGTFDPPRPVPTKDSPDQHQHPSCGTVARTQKVTPLPAPRGIVSRNTPPLHGG